MQVDAKREQLLSAWKQLASTPWQHPEQVPLLVIEEELEVPPCPLL